MEQDIKGEKRCKKVYRTHENICIKVFIWYNDLIQDVNGQMAISTRNMVVHEIK